MRPPTDAAGVIIGAITSTVVGVGEFLYNGLLATVTFMVELGTALVEVGLKIIDELVSSAAAAIVEAAEAIVDAFTALVEWAVSFIEDTLNALFSPIISVIQGMIDSFCNGVYTACAMATADMNGVGSISIGTNLMLLDAITGNLFLTIVGIATVVTTALTILSIVTGPCGFLTNMIVSTIVTLIVVTALSSTIDTLNYVIDPEQMLYNATVALLIWSGATVTQGDLLSTMIDGLILTFELIGMGCIKVCDDLPAGMGDVGIDLAFAVIGIILSIWSVGLEDDDASLMLDIVALMMSTYAFMESVLDAIKVSKYKLANSSPLIILSLAAFISLIGCSKSVWDVKEAVND